MHCLQTFDDDFTCVWFGGGAQAPLLTPTPTIACAPSELNGISEFSYSTFSKRKTCATFTKTFVAELLEIWKLLVKAKRKWLHNQTLYKSFAQRRTKDSFGRFYVRFLT